MDRPTPPPEAALLRLARSASGMQAGDAAAEVARRFSRSLSPSRWSQIENGYETRGGEYKPVTANAATLAQMFAVVGGVTPDRLADDGQRPDAAEILREIERRAAVATAATAEQLAEAAAEDDDLREIAEAARLSPELRMAFITLARAMKAAREEQSASG